MEWRVDREEPTFGTEFLTPKKSCQQSSRNKSTTANLQSKDGGDISFEKLVLRQANAVRYCSTNLNELLGSDIKFKSPGHLLKLSACTPAAERNRGAHLFESHEPCDSEIKFQHKSFNFDLSLRREPRERDEEFFAEAGLSPQVLQLSCPRRDSIEDPMSRHHMHHWQPRADLSDFDSPDRCHGDDYRKRKRKNNLQLKILKNEFSKCDNWNKDKIFHVAQITGLSESQVYKWCWDQKKKVEDQENLKSNIPGTPQYRHLKMDSQRLGLFDTPQREEPEQMSSLAKRRPERERVVFRQLENNRY